MASKKLTNALTRLQEPSTYGGLASILLLAGISLDPGMMQNIVNVGVGISAIAAGLLGEGGKS